MEFQGDGMSEAGLAGTIIGGMLMLPLGLVLLFVLGKKIEDGSLDCTCSCPERPAGNNRPAAAAAAAAPANHGNRGRRRSNPSSPRDIAARRADALAPRRPSVEMHAISTSTTTPAQDAKINFVMEVFDDDPNMTRDKVQRSLESVNWITPDAVNKLLGGQFN
jgi:hypothetical protein